MHILDKTIYQIKGNTVTERELELLIHLSRSNIQFNIKNFLLLAFYHFVMIVFSNFVATPLIFIIEGFSSTLLYNIQFLGLCNMTVYIHSTLSAVFVASFYFGYLWIVAHKADPDNIEMINFWDYSHLLSLILTRCIIVGAKYG